MPLGSAAARAALVHALARTTVSASVHGPVPTFIPENVARLWSSHLCDPHHFVHPTIRRPSRRLSSLCPSVCLSSWHYAGSSVRAHGGSAKMLGERIKKAINEQAAKRRPTVDGSHWTMNSKPKIGGKS